MPWVIFEKASQATPGGRMRRRFRVPKKGRPKERRIEKRERMEFGNVIRFTDGTYIKISDAKGEYEVFVNDELL